MLTSERMNVMTNYLVMSICGLIGGILCAVGDVLFDLKGKGNKKLGETGNIDSNWLKMPYWRFNASILIASVGALLAAFGIFSLGAQISEKSAVLGGISQVTGFIGSMGCIFIHSYLCLQAIIYKEIMEEDRFQLADKVLTKMYKSVAVPFFALYICLLIPSICSIIAIIKGCLDVPMWFVILNPLAFLIIGMLFRVINKEVFEDLPGIVMPSLGLGMLGLIGIVNMI